MSLILNKLSSEVLLALLTALVFLVPGGMAHAQSGTRSFQMSLWDCCDGRVPTSADTDIRTFGDGGTQPAGRSIVEPLDWTTPLSTRSYDWSRIVAVEVDEPYTPVDGDLDFNCSDAPSAAMLAAIAPIDATLAQRAAELKALNPKARFWVNFTAPEGEWMGACATPQVFNRAYIDVISDDYYDVGFEKYVSPFYAILSLYPAKPDQQFALFPGVFSAPTNQVQYLQSYFDYANNMNQTCNLPLGSRGITGIFDRCPVWIVMGWLSGDYQGNTLYRGMLDPNSETIAELWRAELSIPVAPALAHQRTPAQIVMPIVNQFLLDN